MTDPKQSFDRGSNTPARGSTTFPPESWDAFKSTALMPRFVTEHTSSLADRLAFLEGARALRLYGRKALVPQQLVIADVLNANARFTDILAPRRTTKTTSVLAWLVGRCLDREEYFCAYGMMTNQKKARQRFLKDVYAPLDREFPDKKARPFTLSKGNGQEGVSFHNGSSLQFFGPQPDDYRSEAFDVIVLDESGEADPDVAHEVLAAGAPTQDTRPDPMLVRAGTGGKYRKGNLLWDGLELGRAGAVRHAIADYSIEDTDISEMEWEQIAQLLLLSHPGIGNLTTLEAVHDDLNLMGRESFGREYFGMFDRASTDTLFDLQLWDSKGRKGALPQPPAKFALTLSVGANGGSASISAVWREKGVACVLLLAHDLGTGWVRKKAAHLALKYRTPLVYDGGLGSTGAEIEGIKQERPLPRLAPQTWPQVSTAAALLAKEIDAGNVRHWNQEPLNDAIRSVRRRGTPESKRWAFGSVGGSDITPLESISMGLRYYDELPKRAPLKPNF